MTYRQRRIPESKVTQLHKQETAAAAAAVCAHVSFSPEGKFLIIRRADHNGCADARSRADLILRSRVRVRLEA